MDNLIRNERKRSMEKLRLSIGDSAPDYALKSSTGHEVSLSQLWAEGPTVLTFLRHFG
jgi:peroxiredoxin